MDPQKFLEALRKRTVLAAGVKRLFRYQPYALDKLSLLLSRGLIRMSNPRYFNDPYDCRPMLGLSAADSAEDIEGLISYLAATIKLTQPWNGDEFEQQAKRIREDAAFRAGVLDRMSRSYVRFIHAEIRTLCLAISPTDQLLWSHYGDSHRGMCIEFDSTTQPFAQALRVDYVDEYPNLGFKGGSAAIFAEVGMLTKARHWERESEYRLMAAERDGTAYLRSRADYIEVPADSIKSIILGQASGRAQFEEAQRLIKQFNPNVALRVSYRDSSNYLLKISDDFKDRPPPETRAD